MGVTVSSRADSSSTVRSVGNETTQAKTRLLAAAVDFVAANGVADLSLRRLAEAIGTSHRMIIYHFGSKEGLLVEVVRAVEQRQVAVMAELDSDPTASPADIMRQMWRHLADPDMWPHERLFFELYGQALQGRPGTTQLLDGIVNNALKPSIKVARRHGVPAAIARAQARLNLAVIRGLLLDLLATGDRNAADQAMEHFITTYEAAWSQPQLERTNHLR